MLPVGQRRIAAFAVCWMPATVLAQATQPALETLFSELRSNTGAEYVVGRDRLLEGSAEEVRAFLAAKRQAADDPVEQLCLEALIHRADHPGQFEAAWTNAIQAGTMEVIGRDGLPLPGPWPGQTSYSLLRSLGPVSGAYAAELLTKDLLRDDPPWQRLAVVLVMRCFGALPAGSASSHSPNTREQLGLPAQDPRMGWALLRFMELYSHEEGSPRLAMAANLSGALGRFASPELLASARAARDRAHDEPQKERLSRAVRTIESELRDMERRKAAGHPAATATATATAEGQQPVIQQRPTFEERG